MITKEDILTRVKRRSGQIAQSRSIPDLMALDVHDALLEEYLQDALVRIAETGRLRGAFELTTVEDQAKYEIPGSVARIDEVWLDDDRLKQGDALAVRISADDAGTPTQFGFRLGELWLNKKPSSGGDSLRVHVIYGDAYGADTPDEIPSQLPPEFRDALTHYVLGAWFATQGVADLHAYHRGEFETDLERHRYRTEEVRSTKRAYRGLG